MCNHQDAAHKFREIAGRGHEAFSGYGQEDSMEYFLHLLLKIEVRKYRFRLSLSNVTKILWHVFGGLIKGKYLPYVYINHKGTIHRKTLLLILYFSSQNELSDTCLKERKCQAQILKLFIQ